MPQNDQVPYVQYGVSFFLFFFCLKLSCFRVLEYLTLNPSFFLFLINSSHTGYQPNLDERGLLPSTWIHAVMG